MPSKANPSPQYQYYSNQISEQDHDRFLCIMLAPENKRNDLISLYAFNCEVARIRETVSETLLGQMRLQWWREIIENAVPESSHPSGSGGSGGSGGMLHNLICDHDLAKQPLYDLLTARADDLDDIPPPNMDALVNYCQATSSNLIQLSLDILMGKDNQEQGGNQHQITAAQDCGIAWALIGTIRAIPYMASKGHCRLPVSLLREAGIEWQSISAKEQPKALPDIVSVLAREAQNRLESTRQASRELQKTAIPGLLSVPIASYYLKQITKAAYNPFDERLQYAQSPAKTLALLYASWRKKI